ncbi:SLATT domain-containing protein [Endothiovibrio diazotrophicus]
MNQEDGKAQIVPCALHRDSNNRQNLNPDLMRVDESGCVIDDLEKLACLVEGKAIQAANWYLARKAVPKLFSQWIRGLAILGITAGGLITVLQSIDPQAGWGHNGFVVLAVAGALLGLDKYFGFSTAWMRYINAQLKIHQLLAEFQMDWAQLRQQSGDEATAEQEQVMLERIKVFRMAILKQVEQETQEWMNEFRNSIAQLDKETQQRTEALRPGGVAVAVSNAEGIDQGTLKLFVDATSRGAFQGDHTTIKSLMPGAYTIRVEGTRGGQPVNASGNVTVAAGTTVPVTLTLPAAT